MPLSENRRRELGARVRAARREAGLTQRELGKRLGIPLRTVERIEAGEADPHAHAEQLAEITGRPAEWFAPSAMLAAKASADSAPKATAEAGRATLGRRVVLGTLV